MLRLAAAGAALALVGVAASTVPATHDPRTGNHRECFEDEVIVWDGSADEHLHCVPLDDIQEAAVDLYREAVSQEGR